jgi:hypothetical protein
MNGKESYKDYLYFRNDFLFKLVYQLDKIADKIENGIDLSIDQEDLLKELYICYRQDNLKTLNNFKDGKKRKKQN